MAMLNNWFDTKHEVEMKTATAEDALEIIRNDDTLLQEVRTALQAYDVQQAKGRPSRCQTIRKVVAEALLRT